MLVASHSVTSLALPHAPENFTLRQVFGVGELLGVCGRMLMAINGSLKNAEMNTIIEWPSDLQRVGGGSRWNRLFLTRRGLVQR